MSRTSQESSAVLRMSFRTYRHDPMHEGRSRRCGRLRSPLPLPHHFRELVHDLEFASSTCVTSTPASVGCDGHRSRRRGSCTRRDHTSNHGDGGRTVCCRLARHRQCLPKPVGACSRGRQLGVVEWEQESLVLDAAQRHRPRRGPRYGWLHSRWRRSGQQRQRGGVE